MTTRINTIKDNIIIAMFIITKMLILIGIVYTIFAPPQSSFAPAKNTISYNESIMVECANMSADDIVCDERVCDIKTIDDTHCIITLTKDVSGYITLSSTECKETYIISII